MVMINHIKTGARFSIDNGLYNHLRGNKIAVLQHDTSFIVIIDGKSGLGKSSLSNQIGAFMSPNFDGTHIYYDVDSLMEAISTSKKGDYFCLDESMILNSRAAMTKNNQKMMVCMSMIRSKNIFVTLCINSIFNLDKALALDRADTLIHLHGSNNIDRGNWIAFFKADTQLVHPLVHLFRHGSKTYNYSKPHANLRGRFTDEFIIKRKDYDKRKNKEVEKYLKEVKGVEKSNQRDVFFKNLINHFRDTYKLTAKEIATAAKCDMGTIYRILKTTELELMKGGNETIKNKL